MPYYTVPGFATYIAELRIEAESPEEAREIAQTQASSVSDLDFERFDLFEFTLDESNAPELVG